MSVAEDRWLGRPIGEKFVLRRLLGRGGMGAVFEAEDTSMGRLVALKLLEPSARLSRDNAKRFVHEARAAARVHHPNVVSIYDVGVDRITSALFIVQELLRGCDLRVHLATQPGRRLSPEDALELLVPIAEALAAAHRADIVHCDVTPANIFVGDVPKLIDFGLASRVGRAFDSAFGTPQYMAPERAGGHTIDPRSDIWSFGAVLYRCLAGRAIEAERIVPIDELADVSAELAYVVHRALHPALDRRFSSMNEVIQLLRAQLVATRPPSSQSGERPAYTSLEALLA